MSKFTTQPLPSRIRITIRVCRPGPRISRTLALRFPTIKYVDRINPLLQSFLLKYVPQPNMMMAGAADSNNYLDVRNENHIQDEGTFRVDHNFSNGDTFWIATSAGGEKWLLPRAAA